MTEEALLALQSTERSLQACLSYLHHEDNMMIRDQRIDMALKAALENIASVQASKRHALVDVVTVDEGDHVLDGAD